MIVDKAHWHLHGPVKSMRSEVAERDLLASGWAPRRFHQFVLFDESGRAVQLDQRGSEASVHRTRFSYDPEGRLVREESGKADGPIEYSRVWHYDDRGRVVLMSGRNAAGNETLREESSYDEAGRQEKRATFQFDRRIDSYGVDGSEFGYGAPGTVAQVTRYDDGGRPIECDFLDRSSTSIRKVTMSRDAHGRLEVEESHAPAAFMFPRQPDMSDEAFEELQAMIAATAVDEMRTAYEYDAAGRRISRVHRWGLLGEERIAYRYDRHGNEIGHVQVTVRREIAPAEGGGVQTKNETSSTRELRFDYVYDAHDNWTERIVNARITDSGDFAAQNAEWRTFEYYDKR